jgi:hypothetical protein
VNVVAAINSPRGHGLAAGDCFEGKVVDCPIGVLQLKAARVNAFEALVDAKVERCTEGSPFDYLLKEYGVDFESTKYLRKPTETTHYAAGLYSFLFSHSEPWQKCSTKFIVLGEDHASRVFESYYPMLLTDPVCEAPTERRVVDSTKAKAVYDAIREGRYSAAFYKQVEMS